MNEICLFFRQPVTKKLFRHYRVLGKGGFGEVGFVNRKTLCTLQINIDHFSFQTVFFKFTFLDIPLCYLYNQVMGLKVK